MLKFCESEECSFLDEVAAEPHAMQLAEQVAHEVNNFLHLSTLFCFYCGRAGQVKFFLVILPNFNSFNKGL